MALLARRAYGGWGLSRAAGAEKACKPPTLLNFPALQACCATATCAFRATSCAARTRSWVLFGCLGGFGGGCGCGALTIAGIPADMLIDSRGKLVSRTGRWLRCSLASRSYKQPPDFRHPLQLCQQVGHHDHAVPRRSQFVGLAGPVGVYCLDRARRHSATSSRKQPETRLQPLNGRANPPKPAKLCRQEHHHDEGRPRDRADQVHPPHAQPHGEAH
jgi:hypothetical protein